MVKNKVVLLYKIVEFDMLFGRGVFRDGCMFDVGE